MNIFEELDRIQKKGISVTLRFNRSVRFIGWKNGYKDRINISTLRKEGEDFSSTIYRAILNFDEKHPDLL